MSTNKTTLGLNQWELDEKLKMADFNADNQIVDSKLQELDSDITSVDNRLTDRISDVNGNLSVQIGTVNGRVDQLREQVRDLAEQIDTPSELSLFTATATYTAGFFSLTGLPETLPQLFTVRFVAPIDFTEGDRLRIGVVNLDIVTTKLESPPTSAFLAGAAVSLDITGSRAFFKTGGGSGSGYGILPSQTKISAIGRNASAEISLINVGGSAYRGTKLVCKPGGAMPQGMDDGTVHDVGTATNHTISGLVNNQMYSVRAFAYNQDDEVQTDINGAVETVTPVSVPLGTTWTLRQSAADNSWESIAYGNGMFVTVAYRGIGNRVMTSPDGISWTTRKTPADNNWNDVVYANGQFVAVARSGSGNNVMTSPDGVNWTIRTTPTGHAWYSVAYGAGLYVAVDYSNNSYVMTSPDAINWTLRTSQGSGFRSITYGNGLFVAVAGTGALDRRVMTSPDGINWTLRTTSANYHWYRIGYGNGLFITVALNDQGNWIMTSPDGINWTTQQIMTGANSNMFGIAYGNGTYVLTGANRIVTSTDGVNWTQRQCPAANSWADVAYGAGKFVAVSANGSGNRVITSP